ncbi:DMT family transporter [Pseudomonas sp. MAP12]|uniref:DMT family transporter n=1 Tax=Geopseudomonas aromaticivorans TaxID=2849492 RepID=A0ABS6MRI0_9GAMM|nr:DMT family transporter [Pseudomonas aromaticivorans]MBV2131409.1 DMT family transporter [Pseudomonas aromaticivorans]
MSATRQGVDAFALQLMVLLCGIWGLQQVGIKLAAPDMAPLLQVGLRSGIAAVLVALFMLWRRQPLALGDGTLRAGLLVGALFALEFFFVAEGLRHSSAAHIVVLLYTAPIFAALGLHWRVPSERLRRLQWLGIVLAFAGITLAFAGGLLGQHLSPGMLLGDLYGLLAGMSWGALTVSVRCSRLSEAPPAKTLLFQLVCGCLLLLPVAWLGGQTEAVRLTPLVWGNLLFQSVLVAFASYLVWFWLLRRYLASGLGVFSFMTPLFGVCFGVWFLGERIDALFIGGGLLVLFGISLVSADGWWRRLLS